MLERTKSGSDSHMNNWRDKRIADHTKLRASEAFVAQEKRLQRLTEGFALGVHSVWTMTTRAPHIFDEFLTFRFVAETLQSAVAIWSLARHGQITAAKREMRYALESSAKHAYVDLKQMGKPLSEKLKFVETEVPRSSISFVDKLRLFSYSDDENKAFIDEIKSQYSMLCRYVHRSKEQIDEALRLLQRGIAPAFETPREVESFCRDLERLYDLLLVLHFNALGLELAGDVFVHALDHDKSWPYHKSKFTKLLSSQFNYKAERNAS